MPNTKDRLEAAKREFREWLLSDGAAHLSRRVSQATLITDKAASIFATPDADLLSACEAAIPLLRAAWSSSERWRRNMDNAANRLEAAIARHSGKGEG